MHLAQVSRTRAPNFACILVLAGTSIAQAQFELPPMLPVPGLASNTAATAGDFNGDGLLDLAVGYSNGVDHGIAVFMRTGPATFDPPVLTPGLPFLWGQVVPTDLNLDGRTDLIMEAGGVARLISDGAGGFTAIPMSADSDGIFFIWSGIAYADVNGDGHLDILSTLRVDYASSFLNVSLGDGQGNFGPWTTSATAGGHAGQIAAGDLNGDAAPDVLVTRAAPGGGVAILLNDRNGAFSPSSFVPTGAEAVGIALVDLDADGNLDAAVANADSRTVSILKGTGTGGLAVTATYPGPGDATGIVMGDFNNDGRLDLAVSGGGVWTYQGDGAGAFAAPARYAVTGGSWPVDLNADGLLDLAAGSWEMFNVGAGVFAAPRQFPAGAGVAAVAVADMNGDGRPDLVTANEDSDDVAVLLGIGDGTFAAPRLAAAGPGPSLLAIGDWNADGRRDVAVGRENAHDASILLGDGTGGLVSAGSILIPGFDLMGLAGGDLNLDGRDDIVATTVQTLTIDGRIAVFISNGNGSFTAGPQSSIQGRPEEVVLAGFNPDVRLDAAVGLSPGSSYDPHLWTLVGDGTGAFLPPEPQPDGPVEHGFIAVADLNGDGKLDLVVEGRPLAGDGHGGFTSFPAPDLEGLGYPKGVAIADFAGNGKRDLAFGAGVVRLALGDGAGAFGLLNRAFPIGGWALKPVTADFDGDGRPDLGVSAKNSDVVAVLRSEPMPAGADVSLAVTHTPDPAQSQAPLAVTVVVSNEGPLTAMTPVLTFQLPFGVTFVSSNPGAPTCSTSLPPQQNTLVTCSLPDLAFGGTAAITVNVAVQRFPVGYVIPFETRIATNTPVDPDPLDNRVVHLVPVGASTPDLAVALSDSVDPVSPGGTFEYLIDVTNIGGAPSETVNLLGTLQSVNYVGSTPPICNGGFYLACNLPALAPGSSLQIAVTVVAGTFTFVTNSVSVQAPYDANPSNDSATQQTQGALGVRQQLAHGHAFFESFPSGTPAERLYYVSEDPHSSYESIVDATAGDVAGPGQTVLLQRLDTGFSPVQDGQAAGTGPSRTLSWENASNQTMTEVVRVRSTGCGTGCGPGDAYRIRAYETTAQIPRFNTEGTQTTILVLENTTSAAVTGHAWLWDEPGQLVGTVPFSLAARGSYRLDLAQVAPGRKGAVTVSHDGGYGALAGKNVAVEPATGFTFDTPLRVRPR